jgi:hypothetical protein
MRRSLLLLGVIAAMAIGAPAYSQYVYMDVNGDGVNTSADALTSASTVVHVYLDSNHNKAGSVVTCSDGTNPLDIGLFDVLFHAAGSGSVAYNGFTLGGGMTGFAALNPFTVAGNDAGVGYVGGNYIGPGLFLLGDLSITVTGTPTLSFIGTSTDPSIPSPATAFGSHCSGTDNPNYVTLGIDFFDSDGTASPTPTMSTTWGKIKQLYK